MVVDKLGESMQSPEVQYGIENDFWRFIQRDSHILFYEIIAWSGDVYLICLDCDAYIDEPILGRFVDPDSLECVASAWPCGDRTFTGWFKSDAKNLFICWKGDRAGISHHKEWYDEKYWQRTPNPLHQYLEFLRKCMTLHSNGYRPKT